MHKKYLLIAFILFTIIFTGNTQESLKLISYNIWNGFEWGKDSVRKEKLLTWMDNRKPDMVALQELCGYTDEKLSTDANAWGHEHSVLLKNSGYSVGLTSKYPIQVKEKIMEGMHHGALHCESNGIEIFVVHLSPFQWTKRNTEADILLQRISKYIANGKKVVVCGDFNALSPVDAYWYHSNKELLKSKKESDKEHKHVENLREGNFCYSVMSKFYGAGLYDVAPMFVQSGIDRISCPTQVFAEVDADKQRLIQGGMRIDYILTSYNLVEKCIEANIFNGPETYFLSDHYPVEVELELSENE